MSAKASASIGQVAKNQFNSIAVRKAFIDFFCTQNGHQYVRSSPVLPHNDPTLAFTNAGMNQFKGVLLGSIEPPACKVANSQKCVRVGGKHNDLDHVGRDGTHHTFFEMLGNWSFGDYFKERSCTLAWELLTSVYGLNPDRLHVTYFGGDPTHDLPPDLETQDVWRRIGLPKSRLTPGSPEDNFWEMGESGPCGGCTEIHYEINGKLLELWNLVFIEYNRKSDRCLERLSNCHVDTGMGFERLVAVLQGKTSNYDTDLFLPLFDCIQRKSGRPAYNYKYGAEDVTGLDTAYRILADHARMITVCLADGFFPDQEGKLRGIIRKALTVAKEKFGDEGELLKELSYVIASILNEAYPEISSNMKRIHHIIDCERDLLRSLRTETQSTWKALCEKEPTAAILHIDECPNLVKGYHWLQEVSGSITPGQTLRADVAWKMCESFGIPPYLAGNVAQSLGMKLDDKELESEITKSKVKSKTEIYAEDDNYCGKLTSQVLQELKNAGIEPTKDYYKYGYRYQYQNGNAMEPQPASIVALLVDGVLVDHVPYEIFSYGNTVGVILDRTNMYSEAGGQTSDTGTIVVEENMNLDVVDVTSFRGYVVHWTTCSTPSHDGLDINNRVKILVDQERRKGSMKNHTATHLLNAVLKSFLTISEQKSSRVKHDGLRFDFGVYRESLSVEDISNIERIVCDIVRQDARVQSKVIRTDELNNVKCLTTVPGETYLHKSIQIIEIDSGYLLSREPCCGTHVNYTSELDNFVITGYKSISSSVKSIHAVTGWYANKAKENSANFWKSFDSLVKKASEVLEKQPVQKSQVEQCDSMLSNLLKTMNETPLVEYVSVMRLTEQVNELKVKLKYSARSDLRSSMEAEMEDIVDKNDKAYLVHYLQCSSALDNIPLQKASKLCPYKPSLIFARSGGLVKARCCVPQIFVNEKFTAQLWLGHVCSQIEAQGSPPKGQNPVLVFNMKAKKISDEQLKIAIDAAIDFAEHAV